MKREDLLTALEEISDKHIQEAEKPPKKHAFLKMVAAAAVIAVVMNLFSGPALITAYAVTTPSDPRMMERPNSSNYIDDKKWLEDWDKWEAEQEVRKETTAQAISRLRSFFTEGNAQFLQTEKNENKIWSPVNAYIGLSMMAEITVGETKQQVLDMFGVQDTDELRKQVSAVWESVYQDNANEICVLANSLWLEKGLQYNQETMDVLGYHYYASVYQGDLGSNQINRDIAAWINNNTGKFLEDSTKNIQLDEETIMALYSTLYFQARWQNEFSEKNNSDGVFYMPEGESQAVYMNKKESMMDYYWGENFSAVNMYLKNGCDIWFILPDEGMTVEDVLDNGTYMDMLLSSKWGNSKFMKVNLSVPKFDVSSTMDLADGLENMGMTNVFNQEFGEYTNLTSDSQIWLTGANQSVRVQIDEEGVKAATYIEIPGAGSPAPPDEVVDFILNRPFLFVITNENIPLFVGCVNNPQG